MTAVRSLGAGEVLRVQYGQRPLWQGSGLDFEDRGTTRLKGIPGEWRLFAVRFGSLTY